METALRVQWVRRLAVILVVWTFALMVLGSWVKATDSGLSCPDWPTCYGQYLPPFPSVENGGVDEAGNPIHYTQAQVLYEWAHRAVASLLGIPYLALVFVAWFGKDLHRTLRTLPLMGLAVLGIQVLLGRGTVLQQNPAWLTTLHLATATLFFFLVTCTMAVAFLRPLAGVDTAVLIRRPASPANGWSAGEVPRFPGEPSAGSPPATPARREALDE